MIKCKIIILVCFSILISSCSSTERDFQPITEFRDCDECPIMVALPQASYLMGDLSKTGRKNEQPVREIKIDKPISISKYPVTIAEFRLFITESGYKTEAELSQGCWNLRQDMSLGWVESDYWDNTRMNQTENHPVVCVSLNDAIAYTEWLSEKTKLRYRIPTEAEWEFSARAGSSKKYIFGDTAEGVCDAMNWSDDKMTIMWGGTEELMVCDDGYLFTSPVGSFPPNNFGLYDIYGNVWEWTIDCYQDDMNAVIIGQRTHSNHGCNKHPLRGASFSASLKGTTASYRISDEPYNRTADYGFRIVRDMKM